MRGRRRTGRGTRRRWKPRPTRCWRARPTAGARSLASLRRWSFLALRLGFFFVKLARRRVGRPLARHRNDIVHVAYRPLADAIAAAPLGEVNVDVVLVVAVGRRAEHGGKARAGAGLEAFAKTLRHRDVGQLIALAVRERECADVDGVSLAVLAHLGACDTVAAAALIRVEVRNGLERSPKLCGGDRPNVLAHPCGDCLGSGAAQHGGRINGDTRAILQRDGGHLDRVLYAASVLANDG